MITVADYLVHRNIDGVADYDALIASKIAAAVAIAEKETGRDFGIYDATDEYGASTPQTFTELHDGNGSPILVLRNVPVEEVESITILSADDGRDEYDADD